MAYLTLMSEEVLRREYSLREVLNGLRWIVRAGALWRNDTQRCIVLASRLPANAAMPAAGVFQALVDGLGAVLRIANGCFEKPTATIFDSRTVQSTLESGSCADYNGAKRRRGSNVHIAVGTLGHLLRLHGTTANERD